jgi:hypothetical protein
VPDEPVPNLPIDESADYWNRTYDRETRLRDSAPQRPRTKAQRHAPAIRRPPDPRRDGGPPRVRSGAEALGGARRYVDAVLMVGFGIVLIAAGSTRDLGPRSALVVLIGIGAIGYAGHIALFARSYTMPYLVYGVAAFFGLWFLFG